MALTLFDLLLECYKRLGHITISKATATGAVTSLVDSSQTGALTKVNTDAWKDGGLFIIRDAAGASAAPEKEFALITAFASDTGTFTHETLTAASAAGDVYGFTTVMFPFREAIEQANSALMACGDVALTDTTTLDSDSDYTEYAASVGWKRNIFRVDIQTSTDTSNNKWQRIHDYDYVPAAANAAGKIILGALPEDGYDLRIWYMGAHPLLTAASSVVREEIYPELAVQRTMLEMIRSYNGKTGGSEPYWIQRQNDIANEVFKLETQHPLPKYYGKPPIPTIEWEDE